MTLWPGPAAIAAFFCTLILPAARAQQTVLLPPSIDRAWSMLASSAAPDKSQNDRIQALAALGTMGADPRAEHIIGDAIVGKDMDVRTAAILAADKSKNPQLITKLRAALDDPDPQVAYAAATTLWKMHDSSGEDLLLAVVAGDTHDKLGMIKAEKHKAAKEMHSPGALARIGIIQGSGFFLGPFGFGVKAIDYIHKNGGDPGRAAAVDMLAEEHTETVHEALIYALTDKDFAVRAAAAKGLGDWPGNATAEKLRLLFDDDKLAVRLTAAAAYIRVFEPHPSPEAEKKAPHTIREVPPKSEPGLEPAPVQTAAPVEREAPTSPSGEPVKQVPANPLPGEPQPATPQTPQLQ
jgi:HEAT repeat protein